MTFHEVQMDDNLLLKTYSLTLQRSAEKQIVQVKSGRQSVTSQSRGLEFPSSPLVFQSDVLLKLSSKKTLEKLPSQSPKMSRKYWYYNK